MRCSQFSRMLEIKQSKMSNLSTLSKELFSQLTTKLQMAINLAKEKGPQAGSQLYQYKNMLHKTASEMLLIWLATFPYSFSLCMWINLLCRSCSIMSKGRIPINMLLYNEVRDLTAELLTDDVETHLQPFNNETFYYKTANI